MSTTVFIERLPDRFPGSSKEMRWVVWQDAAATHYIMRFRNTRTDTHPFKVWPMEGGRVQQSVSPIFVYPPRSLRGMKAVQHALDVALRSVAEAGWPAPNAEHRTFGLEHVS